MFFEIIKMYLLYAGLFILSSFILVLLISLICGFIDIVKYFNNNNRATRFIIKIIFQINSFLLYLYMLDKASIISEVSTNSRIYYIVFFIPIFSLISLSRITSKSYFKFHEGKSNKQIEIELESMSKDQLKSVTVSSLLGLSFSASMLFPLLANCLFVIYPNCYSYISSYINFY